MSKTDETEITRDSMEVVRMKVDGSKGYVNTLRDQQTARGLSLICPFPALEAEIPVTFGLPGAVEMRKGTIHRIGVEDDPETGLPRLRLSVRAHETRATVISPPKQDLIDETSRMTEAADERAETDIDVVVDSCVDIMYDLESGPDEAAVTGAAIEYPPPSPEPAWVGCDELPLPAEFVERMRTRKRRRVAGVAAWTAVLAIAAVGAYALVRAGILDLDSVRDRVGGILADRGAGPAEEETALPAGPEDPGLAMDLDGNAVALGTVGDDDEAISEPGMSLLEDEVSTPEDLDGVGDLELTEASHSIGDASDEEAAADEAESIETVNDITLLLPTRWRAEYANAYRLRDPNGVVVDVPGGLVQREGWLEVGKGHPMIRSVKAVQRETGARFVIFIHGELPRFLTTTKPGGIALRLYREPMDQPTVSEQVAVLD